MGQQGQETVAQDVGERQRHAQIFGGGERQPDVLLAEGAAKPAGSNIPSAISLP